MLPVKQIRSTFLFSIRLQCITDLAVRCCTPPLLVSVCRSCSCQDNLPRHTQNTVQNAVASTQPDHTIDGAVILAGGRLQPVQSHGSFLSSFLCSCDKPPLGGPRGIGWGQPHPLLGCVCIWYHPVGDADLADPLGRSGPMAGNSLASKASARSTGEACTNFATSYQERPFLMSSMLC